MKSLESNSWYHSPKHFYIENTNYIITAGTYKKALFFNTESKLNSLEETIFDSAEKHGWLLQAWAIFANHYHLIAQSPDDPKSLSDFIRRINSTSAIMLNKIDNTTGRKVWFQYWDHCLTFEASYLARLNYVHNNPVKHGLVTNAELYPHCSASWFRMYADRTFHAKVTSFKYDKIKIEDDY